MQVHVLDPAYTASEQARQRFRLALWSALGFVALIWLIEMTSVSFDLDLARFGIRPRELAGLAGILFAPLLHASFEHLIANSVPLWVMLTMLLHVYPQSARWVLPAIYAGPGIVVWLFARAGTHVGASGLVYGLVSYIFLAGVLRRDKRAIAGSLLMSFLYGSLAWGVLPMKPGVSWETHLAAASIGALLALALRRLDIPPRRRYTWEDDGPDEEA